MADADIVLTNASNDGGQILFKSFRYDWGEAGSTTWDALETEIMAAVGTKTVVSGGLPSLGGKKPFELHDYQAVEKYDYTAYQGSFSSDALKERVQAAAYAGEAGVSFLLLRESDSKNGIQFYTKDATRDKSGTSTTDQWGWNGDAWAKGEGTVSRYDQVLAYFGMTEEEFQQAISPKLKVTLEKIGIQVATGILQAADVTSANTVRTSAAGTCTVTDKDGAAMDGLYYSNQNGGVLYLGRYDFSQVRSAKVTLALMQGPGRFASVNLAAWTATARR